MKNSTLKRAASGALVMLAGLGAAASAMFAIIGPAQAQSGSRVCAYYGTKKETKTMYVAAIEYNKDYSLLCDDASDGYSYVSGQGIPEKEIYKWPNEGRGTCEEFGLLLLMGQYGQDPCLKMKRLEPLSLSVQTYYFQVQGSPRVR
jgi:hypothetical protein